MAAPALTSALTPTMSRRANAALARHARRARCARASVPVTHVGAFPVAPTDEANSKRPAPPPTAARRSAMHDPIESRANAIESIEQRRIELPDVSERLRDLECSADLSRAPECIEMPRILQLAF